MENKYQAALNYIVDNFVNNIEVKDGQSMNKETECVMVLQELVNKETPKKPSAQPKHFYSAITGEKLEDIVLATKCCPNCDNILNPYWKTETPNYCANCGQKIDWSDK